MFCVSRQSMSPDRRPRAYLHKWSREKKKHIDFTKVQTMNNRIYQKMCKSLKKIQFKKNNNNIYFIQNYTNF